jgi:hypothetical protein
MNRSVRAATGFFVLFALLGAVALQGSSQARTARADAPVETVVQQNLDGSQFVYVVFHALDRDGFCASRGGSISLHPVINTPVDFIIETSNGFGSYGRSANDVLTFSTLLNASSTSPVRVFAPLVDGIEDECQAWIKVSQSIPGPLRVLVTLPGDDGKPIGFIADLDRRDTAAVKLSFRWTLLAWTGATTSTADALSGSGAASGGTNVSNDVTAVYAWNAASQSWLAYFPGGANIPGANNLTSLETGQSYWFAIEGPGGVTWNMPVVQ